MANLHRWAAAIALCSVTTALPARASCWAEHDVVAAQVREMQTMLMVAALRCRAAHIDISADYDGFVTAQRAAIDRANMTIKLHFAQAGGQQSDYDHFATSLANRFGDDDTSESTCAEAAALARDGAAAAPSALEAIASARIFPARLPGGVCAGDVNLMPLSLPANKTTDLPPFINVAAPTAVADPVTLPADVLAAMTVLARFQSAPSGASASGLTQIAAVQP